VGAAPPFAAAAANRIPVEIPVEIPRIPHIVQILPTLQITSYCRVHYASVLNIKNTLSIPALHSVHVMAYTMYILQYESKNPLLIIN
jgi:hypothetical protein